MNKAVQYFLTANIFFLSAQELFSQVLGTYNCTGSTQSYSVPAGICQVKIKAWGAGGAGGGVDAFGGGAGGGGSYADVTINVTAGDVLTIYTGCQGIAGTGCATNAGGTGGFGYGSGGNGGAAGPVPCSGSGGGGGGSSGVLKNGVPVIAAAGGGGGGGGGCNSAGGDGGAGGVNGTSTACGAGGGNASSSGSQNGAAGISHTADGGGGGGGGGGYVNGGNGGGVPAVGPSCGAGDCGAAGAGGGDSYAPAGTITLGAGTIPGNSGDPDLCPGCAQGGASQSNGTDGFVEILSVNTPVIANAASNSPICQGMTLSLTSSGGTSYSWGGPNFFTSIQQNPSIVNAQPSVSGSYTVLVTDANGCTAVGTVNAVVNPLPIANAGNDLTLCNGDIAPLNASGGTSYSWTPVTSLSNPNISNPNANPNTSISYTVFVTDANNCSSSDSLYITVNPLPTANAGADASICEGFSTSFNASGGGNYLWSPAAGLNNPAIANPTASSTITTNYTVTVTDANGCTDEDDMILTINPRPAANFSVTAVCFNNPTQFTDLSIGNIAQWDWAFGDGNTSTVQNPSHTYNSAGTFVALLIVTTPEGCKDTFGLTVTVHPLPSASFSSTTVCVNALTCFTDQSTITSGSITVWSWNFDDPNSGGNNISNSQNPCHTYSASGTYNVVLTVTSNNNCQTTAILPVIVLAPPVAAFNVPNVCLNNPTQFTDASTGGGTQWNWAFGDGNTSTSQNPPHTYLGYGNYIVTLIVSSGGTCADTISDTAVVYPMPVVNFTADTVCRGDTTSFLDLSFIPAGAISSWSWNFGDGNTSTQQSPSHVYASGGTYTVTLTAVSNNNCSASLTLTSLVYSLPIADFTSSPAPSGQLIDEVEFTDLSAGNVTEWFWNFGDGDTSSQQFPSHLYADTGNYVVTLIVTSINGCMDTVQHLFEVRDFAFYIPNTFTPNGDEQNDFFSAKGIGITNYEMWIFDRWGNAVFYCSVNGLPQSVPCLWDGKVRGGSSDERVQEDVYVYKVHFTSVFKKEYTFVGNVNAVR